MSGDPRATIPEILKWFTEEEHADVFNFDPNAPLGAEGLEHYEGYDEAHAKAGPPPLPPAASSSSGMYSDVPNLAITAEAYGAPQASPHTPVDPYSGQSLPVSGPSAAVAMPGYSDIPALPTSVPLAASQGLSASQNLGGYNTGAASSYGAPSLAAPATASPYGGPTPAVASPSAYQAPSASQNLSPHAIDSAYGAPALSAPATGPSAPVSTQNLSASFGAYQTPSASPASSYASNESAYIASTLSAPAGAASSYSTTSSYVSPDLRDARSPSPYDIDSAGSNAPLYGGAALAASARSEAAPAGPSAPHISGRNWNEEYQAIVDLPETDMDARITKQTKIHHIFAEFLAVVEDVGKALIDDLAQPPETKSFKAVNVGGIAGGEKHFASGIFFKLCVDLHELYGGAEWAFKVANLELLGLNSYALNTSIAPVNNKLRTPMMALLDYKGYRLLAISILPIDKSTLVYGSADAGVTFQNSDPQVAEWMKALAKTLNIKEHGFVPLKNRDVVHQIHAPVDIEVHKARDGRYYARLPSPLVSQGGTDHSMTAIRITEENEYSKLEVTTQNLADIVGPNVKEIKLNEGILAYNPKNLGKKINTVASALAGFLIYGTAYLIYGKLARTLFKQLRPEFVKAYSKALNSDACTAFGLHNASEHNIELSRATNYLLEVVLIDFAEKLEKFDIRINSGQDLIRELHKVGGNIRHLALIKAQLMGDSRPHNFVITEMIFRCTKNFLRRKIRSLHTFYASKPDKFKASLLKYINLLFNYNEAGRFYWKNVIKVQLEAKFGEYGRLRTKGTAALPSDVRDMIRGSFLILYYRTMAACGITLTPLGWDVPIQLGQALYHKPIEEAHLQLNLTPTIKTLRDYGLHGKNVEIATCDNSKGLVEVDYDKRGPYFNQLALVEVLPPARRAFYAAQSCLDALDKNDIPTAAVFYELLQTLIRPIRSFELLILAFINYTLAKYYSATEQTILAERHVAIAYQLIGNFGGLGPTLKLDAWWQYRQFTHHPFFLLVGALYLELVELHVPNVRIYRGKGRYVARIVYPLVHCYNQTDFSGDGSLRKKYLGDEFPLMFTLLESAIVSFKGPAFKVESLIHEDPRTHPQVVEWFNFASLLNDIPSGIHLSFNFTDQTEWMRYAYLPSQGGMFYFNHGPQTTLAHGTSLKLTYWLPFNGEFVVFRPRLIRNGHYPEPVKDKEKPMVKIPAPKAIGAQLEIPASAFPEPGLYGLEMVGDVPGSFENGSMYSTYLLFVPPESRAGHAMAFHLINPHFVAPLRQTEERVQTDPICQALQCGNVVLVLDAKTQIISWWSYTASPTLDASRELSGMGRAMEPSEFAVRSIEGLTGKQIVSLEVSQREHHKVVNPNVRLPKLCAAAISNDGLLYCWGTGPTGHGDTFAPRQLKSLYETVIARVAVSNQFTLALDINGALYAWGEGLTDKFQQNTPCLITDFPKRLKQISAASQLVAALTEDGEVWLLGRAFSKDDVSGDFGCVKMDLKRKVKQLATGYNHCMLLFEDGTIATFGRNDHNQLGSRSAPALTSFNQIVTPVLPGANGTKFGSIYARFDFSVAVSASDPSDFWAWGDGSPVVHRFATPFPIQNCFFIALGTTYITPSAIPPLTTPTIALPPMGPEGPQAPPPLARKFQLFGNGPDSAVARAPAKPAEPVEVHLNHSCDGCNVSPIKSPRYDCTECIDYNLCKACMDSSVHPEHQLVRGVLGSTSQPAAPAAKPSPPAPTTLIVQEQDEIHAKFRCDGCDMEPIKGPRFDCTICSDYNLCHACLEKKVHSHHSFVRGRLHTTPVPVEEPSSPENTLPGLVASAPAEAQPLAASAPASSASAVSSPFSSVLAVSSNLQPAVLLSEAPAGLLRSASYLPTAYQVETTEVNNNAPAPMAHPPPQPLTAESYRSGALAVGPTPYGGPPLPFPSAPYADAPAYPATYPPAYPATVAPTWPAPQPQAFPPLAVSAMNSYTPTSSYMDIPQVYGRSSAEIAATNARSEAELQQKQLEEQQRRAEEERRLQEAQAQAQALMPPQSQPQSQTEQTEQLEVRVRSLEVLVATLQKTVEAQAAQIQSLQSYIGQQHPPLQYSAYPPH